MKKTLLIIFVLISQVNFLGYGQEIDLSNSKKTRLKNTNYNIAIPRGYKIETTNGIDFLGFSISENEKKFEDNIHIWLYLGYFPKSMAESSNYTIIDSTTLKILNDTVICKIYKSEQEFLIEGKVLDKIHTIQTQIYFDKPLQLYMWGKTKSYNRLETIIGILQTLE